MKKKYWFKRKRYGWGWVPITWQGWTIVLVELVFLLALAQTLLNDVPPNTYQSEVGIFVGFVILSTLVLIYITYKKGPPPKWRWGKSDDDDPELDF